MAYMDSHYGHYANILDIDTYTSDRVMSVGLDRQVIFWKINEDSQLLYKAEAHSADTISVINSSFFLTGSIDNKLNLWTMSKKKPIFTLHNVHKESSWILKT